MTTSSQGWWPRRQGTHCGLVGWSLRGRLHCAGPMKAPLRAPCPAAPAGPRAGHWAPQPPIPAGLNPRAQTDKMRFHCRPSLLPVSPGPLLRSACCARLGVLSGTTHTRSTSPNITSRCGPGSSGGGDCASYRGVTEMGLPLSGLPGTPQHTHRGNQQTRAQGT